jgi:hypothetical protein
MYPNAPDFGQDEKAIVEGGTIAELLVSETIIPIAALEAGIARCLSLADATVEGVNGAIQARQYVLQDLRMEVAIFGPRLLDGGQLGTLAGDGDADAALLPRPAPLLKGSIVEFAAAAHDKRQRRHLLGGRFQLVLEGLAYALLVHLHPAQSLNIAFDRFLAAVASRTEKVRARPQRRQFAQVQELLTQQMRVAALDEPGNVRGQRVGGGAHEEVDMIGVDHQPTDFPLVFIRYLPDDVASSGHAPALQGACAAAWDTR